MVSDLAQTICIGGATIDRAYRTLAPVRLGTSNPVIGSGGFGGVARNVAETIARLECPVTLSSVVGDDNSGWAIVNHLAAVGVDVDPVEVANARPTAEYLAVLNQDGSLCIGIANMAIFDEWTVASLAKLNDRLQPGVRVFADTNVPSDVLSALIERRRQVGFWLAIDAVSVVKAERIPRDLSGIDMLFCNQQEAASILGASSMADLAALAEEALKRGVGAMVISRGRRGCHFADGTGAWDLPAVPAEVLDETGAGDGLIGGTIAGLVHGVTPVDAVRQGLAVAALTVEFPGSVRPDLTPPLVADALSRLS